MKKLIYLLLVAPSFMFSQINLDMGWAAQINPICDNLEKQRIESGMLLDYAPASDDQ
ncbi:hypothetical protein [Psychroflexus maritimus]|uniref:Uncharacterized protein n=1 Tax=Psychroflexus maritimus TaxID=2714865 RepID=A0A967DYT7_9FLAO|nr:hypothetical protein [Psychroflexus maritimus]NGZ89478.1 hypothetical protein [Psychroflexus maritimus]